MIKKINIKAEWDKIKQDVASENKLGKTLIVGHLAKYWEEAAFRLAERVSENKVSIEKYFHQIALDQRDNKIDELLELADDLE